MKPALDDRTSTPPEAAAGAPQRPVLSISLAATERTLPQHTVLCVQQDPEVQQFLEDALCDFRVIVAPTADAAVRRLNSEPFDAYVLDYWLSGWSGVSLCRQIRRTDPHVPVIIYATAAGGDNRARALRAGASSYIEAPADPAMLARRLRILIQEADTASLHARVEEARVIQEELERQTAAAAARAENAMQRAAKAIEHAAKVKAFKAFVDAGGARASFERWWPQQFDSGWSANASRAGDVLR